MPTKSSIKKLYILNRYGDSSLCYIGENFSCPGVELRLWEGKDILIGEDIMSSWNVMFFTSDGHGLYDKNGNRINQPDDIVINDHVWIGHNVKILQGSFINSGCVVGTLSLIKKKYYEKNAILIGQPATIRRTGIQWDRLRKTSIPPLEISDAADCNK